MEALRIVLKQDSASYKKEETNINKMTYPLPPFSTIIGAIHSSCNYKEYKPMDISIQGNYSSLNLDTYRNSCFLNNVMDDRGLLVKLKNPNSLSNAYEKVAKAIKSKGNSFRERKTIKVFNENLLKEYIFLKDLGDKFKGEYRLERDSKINLLKEEKKKIINKKKEFKDDKILLKEIKEEEKILKEKIKKEKLKFDKWKEETYIKPYSRFKTLTNSIKYYEKLNDVNLIIHIKSEKETLLDIKENIYNIKSIGRSEDFVYIKEAKIVNLVDRFDGMENLENKNLAYVDYNLAKNKIINRDNIFSDESFGTKYYINKEYKIKEGKRIFNKKKVLFISEYKIKEPSKNIYFDINDENKYIVNFL